MQEEKFRELLDKYIKGESTLEERAWLENAYMIWNVADRMTFTNDELQAVYILMWNNVGAATQPVSPRRLWPRIMVVHMAWKIAAAVSAITLGTWFYYTTLSSRIPRDLNRNAIQNDIAPGRNTATLTLANGKIINLDTNKASIVVTDSLKSLVPSEVGMTSVSTPRGGTYQITLPDGTEVWLNADSKISFPSQFTDAKRRVSLEGEAYFQVAKDKKHSFIVESRGQSVEVLGTHFNIKSYADERSTKTTLLEGSVKVSSWRGSTEIPDRVRYDTETSSGRAVKNLGPTGPGAILKPGQQSVLLRRARGGLGLTDSRILVKEANVDQEIAWKNGQFRFNDENIYNIMLQLARWYNIEVVYEGEAITEGFTGKVSKAKNISEVLMILEKTKGVHFKIEGRRVTVIK